MDPARILALARMIASDHHPRWRDVAESAAAEHLWRASLRFDGRGSCEAWATSVARLRARSAVAVEAARACRAARLEFDPTSPNRDDPESRAVAADQLRRLTPQARTVATARICGATWAQAGAAIDRSSFTARGLLAA